MRAIRLAMPARLFQPFPAGILVREHPVQLRDPKGFGNHFLRFAGFLPGICAISLLILVPHSHTFY